MTNHAQPTRIDVPFPSSGNRRLRLTIGPAHLKLRPGAGDRWVVGTYHDPVGTTPCDVITDGAQVQITQKSRWRGMLRETPTFDLLVGTAQPFELVIEAGAVDQSEIDLGGLPLTSADITTAAGKVVLSFSAPNPQPMTRLHLKSGASEFDAINLGNANASEIAVEGGAAAIRLSFGGELQRDSRVTIKVGAAALEVSVPRTTAAKITQQSFLGSLDAGDGFMTRDGAYWTEGALLGGTPVLSIATSIAVGSLKLRATD